MTENKEQGAEQLDMEEKYPDEPKPGAAKKTASKKTAAKKTEVPGEETAPEEDPNNQLALLKRDVVDYVQERIEQLIGEGSLDLPPNYSAHNAMLAAWLVLQETEDKDGNPALEVCDKNSQANALLSMVIQGLTPARKQCYFIVYGNKLVCQRSYFGTSSVLKRIFPGAREFTEIVYEGDEFEYAFESGRKRVTKHTQLLENVDDSKIVAGYCVVEPGPGHEPMTIILTIEQITNAWKMGNAYASKSTTHEDFGTEMAKKTLISNACKILINSADDSYLRRAVQTSDVLGAEAAMDGEVEQHGNSEEININLGGTDTADAEVVEEEATDGPGF